MLARELLAGHYYLLNDDTVLLYFKIISNINGTLTYIKATPRNGWVSQVEKIEYVEHLDDANATHGLIEVNRLEGLFAVGGKAMRKPRKPRKPAWLKEGLYFQGADQDSDCVKVTLIKDGLVYWEWMENVKVHRHSDNLSRVMGLFKTGTWVRVNRLKGMFNVGF